MSPEIDPDECADDFDTFEAVAAIEEELGYQLCPLDLKEDDMTG